MNQTIDDIRITVEPGEGTMLIERESAEGFIIILKIDDAQRLADTLIDAGFLYGLVAHCVSDYVRLRLLGRKSDQELALAINSAMTVLSLDPNGQNYADVYHRRSFEALIGATS